MVHHGLPRVLAFYESITDLSPWIRRFTGSDDYTMKLMPRPYITFEHRF